MNEQTEQQPENFPLDEAAIEALAEYDQQERTINVARSAACCSFQLLYSTRLPGKASSLEGSIRCTIFTPSPLAGT